MSRSTVTAVSLTAVVLIAAGQLPRMPWEIWAESLRWSPGSILASVRHGVAAFVTGPWPPLILGALFDLALLALLSSLARWAQQRRGGSARARVFALARRGVDRAGIARRARLPQDTVRALLAAGALPHRGQ